MLCATKTLATASASMTASQLCRMAAFLLPLKVLYIALTGAVPAFLEPLMQTLGFDGVLYTLAGLTLILYATHLALDHVANRAEEKGSESTVTLTADKYHRAIFTKSFAARAHSLVARLFSSLALVVLLSAGLFWSVDHLLLLLACQMGIGFAFARSRSPLAALDRKARISKVNQRIGLVSSLCFLGGFLLLLQQALQPASGSTLITILSIVALRLLSTQQSTLLRTAYQIADHKRSTAGHLGSFSLRHGRTTEQPLSERLFELPFLNSATNWRLLNSDSTVVRTFAAESIEGPCLYRVFTPNSEDASIKERLLSAAATKVGLIQAPYELLDGGHEITLASKSEVHPISRDALHTARSMINAKAWAIEPTDEMSALVVTKPLDERFSVDHLAQLCAQLDAQDKAALDKLRAHIPEIIETVSTLPRVVSVKTARDAIVLGPKGEPQLIAFTHWSIEPLGTTWDGYGLESPLHKLVAIASKQRPALQSTPQQAVEMAYALMQLDSALTKRRFGTARDQVVVLNRLMSR